ncbi:MAG: transglycosylase SLT domain-containing protein [Saprospiraceae bacterium]|nr:transglycosylase SLT domain-containing protein [Saprospiraceae bacterium]
MKKGIQFYTLALAAFFTIAILGSYSTKDEKVEAKEDGKAIPQIVKSVDMDKKFTFAGEILPMDNFDVRERLERELTVNTYWHSSTILTLKESFRHFPMIERILEEEGIPDDFKYLAVAESGLRNVTSPAGAKGFWQFMEATGEYYGLEISSEVDERYHLEKATRAACDYLKDYKKRFGSWLLVAAAYNMGGTRMARSLKEQRADSYFDLNLNVETSRYVFRIVAIKEIFKDPRKFGFYFDESEVYQPLEDYDIVKVTGSVENWGDFAAEHDISYRMLKVYNPWLIDGNLTNRSGKTYEIKIPRKKF